MPSEFQKIAVAVVHGVGKQTEMFTEPLKIKLRKQFARELKDVGDDLSDQLVIEPVFWQVCIQPEEDALWDLMKQKGTMSWNALRRMMIDLAGDAVAYQPDPSERNKYIQIHKVMAGTLNKLASEDSAGPKAPLCVIAHSLGTVIASNYLYDLQSNAASGGTFIDDAELIETIGDTPLEKGETLARLFTLGSPIAVWSLRYPDFGTPIEMPSPGLRDHWPDLSGEWINIYDKDDVIAYPLKPLNNRYGENVTRDLQINVGWLHRCWNPSCHTEYWTNSQVVRTIARSLANTWRAVNS